MVAEHRVFAERRIDRMPQRRQFRQMRRRPIDEVARRHEHIRLQLAGELDDPPDAAPPSVQPEMHVRDLHQTHRLRIGRQTG